MQAPRRTGRTRGLTLACAIIAAVVASPAARADDGEDNLPDAVLFREMLKALGMRGNDTVIDYRERSPLVVPPALTLPAPETRTIAERNPQWPVDQDVRRRQEAKATRAKARPFEVWRDANPLGPDELAPGRGRASRGSVSGPYGTTGLGEGTSPQSPSALGYVGGLFDSVFGRDKEKSKPFTGEPPRTALVEPPPGYQTPSPVQPYGVGKQKNDVKLYEPMEGVGPR